MNLNARIPLLLAAAVLALAACSKETPAPAASQAAAAPPTPVSVETIVAEAKGFNVGSSMATRVAYVFFDPQCPHCAALWQAAKPLKAQARFVWIPVSLLNDKSGPQGATLLHAPDPVAAMDQHEASLNAKQGGITAVDATDAQKAVVKANTTLFNRFGLASVPSVIAKHATTGQLVTVEGAMPTARLAEKLGLAVPAGPGS